jgi:hypothetical protein
MDRITAIRKSLSGFVCGILGVFPVIGIIPALCAVSYWSSVRRHYQNQWNPAKPYLVGGLLLALFGILSSAVIFCVVLFMCFGGP